MNLHPTKVRSKNRMDRVTASDLTSQMKYLKIFKKNVILQIFEAIRVQSIMKFLKPELSQKMARIDMSQGKLCLVETN